MVSAAAAFFGGERRAASARGGGIRVLDREAAAGDRVDEIDLGALEVPDADRIDEQLDAVRLEHLVAVAAVFLDHQPVLEAGAPSALHEHAQTAVLLLLFGQKLGDLGGCRRRHVNHVISPEWNVGSCQGNYTILPLRAAFSSRHGVAPRDTEMGRNRGEIARSWPRRHASAAAAPPHPGRFRRAR